MTVAPMFQPNAAIGRRRSPTRLRFDADTFDRLRDKVLPPAAFQDAVIEVEAVLGPA